MRRAAAMGLAGLLVVGAALFVLWPRPRAPAPSPAPERCLDCHAGPGQGPGGIHEALAGCEACHLGDPTATEEDRAHVGMEREPGALDTADRTCGRGGCHPSQLARVLSSPMTTARGLIAVDRWGFGERAVPTSTETAADVLAAPHPTPAQDHLRRLCLGCHLGVRQDNRDDMLAGTTSGCSACHVAKRPSPEAPHPVVDRAAPDARCFGCHSRSGRVSLSYRGWAEVRGPELEACATPTKLEDGRHVCDLPPDAHQAAGLACVDCHLHTEIMGDGVSRAHEEQQVEVRCESCHGPAEGLQTTWGAVKDGTSRRLLALNGETVREADPVRTGVRGTPLWNVSREDGAWWLRSKLGAGRRRIAPTPEDPQHKLPGHERVSCVACHAAWTPSCPTCHTTFDPADEQWDFGTSTVAVGRWVETAERYFALPPTLALRGDRVVAAAPGMIATLDARAAGGERRHGRWFAAFDPHTTARAPRDCAGCHRSPRALGLGAGALELEPEPRFRPADGGPVDAPNADGWVGLFPGQSAPGTRPEVRSLDRETQWRLLRVGACLDCHDGPNDPLYESFEAGLARLGAKKARSCRKRDHRWLHSLPDGVSRPTR